MYIIDAIEDLYESAEINSPQEYVSEYLLRNLRIIPERSLSSLAEEIGVSKGYLSKYTSRLTIQGTYAAFQNALSQEIGYSSPDPASIMAEAHSFTSLNKHGYMPKEKQIREITDLIESCSFLWIIGDRSCRGIFTYLMRAFWENNGRTKYVTGDRLIRSPEMISCISENDLVMIISVNDSPDEYILKNVPTLEIISLLKKQRCRILFIGEDHGPHRGITVCSLGDALGFYASVTALQRFVAALTESFMKRKRINVHEM